MVANSHEDDESVFTRYLYDVQNGVEEDARAWIVREDGGRRNPTAYDDYPNPEAKPVVLRFGGGGREVGQLTLSTPKKKLVEKFTDNFEKSGSTLAQADSSEHRLLYVTPELKQDLHLSGISRLNIRLAANAEAANLSVWMVSLPWTKSVKITDNIITRGWADPQNHQSLSASEPLVPGQFYEISFTLQPDDQVIPAGQKIG